MKKIDHIGIAVKDLDEVVHIYKDLLKMPFLGFEIVEEQKVKVAMFQVGDSKIEFLMPTSPDSPIAIFIEKKGEGIHHIAYEVDKIEESLEDFKGRGIKLIDETPRNGAHNMKIAFLHPKSTGKVLTELCQKGEE